MARDSYSRALEALWKEPERPARRSGLNRDRIVAAAIELADAEGIDALSMAKLAERLSCGTMSLYRHIAGKDELLIFMLSTAPGPPPEPEDPRDWRANLTAWALQLRDVYRTHPWILRAATLIPPLDPGQLAWLEAGLSALQPTGLDEAERLSSVMSMLYYVGGAVSFDVETRRNHRDAGWAQYPEQLRTLLDPDRFPQVAAAVAAGALDDDDQEPPHAFLSGVARVLDGIAARAAGGQ